MTQEELSKVRDGLNSRPRRYFPVDGMQPTSHDELDHLIKIGRLVVEESSTIAETSPETPATPDVAPATEPETSELSKLSVAELKKLALSLEIDPLPTKKDDLIAAIEGVEAEKQDPADQQTTPATQSTDSTKPNLLTFTYQQLLDLAKELGIDPVPTVQNELIATIEAKQQGS